MRAMDAPTAEEAVEFPLDHCGGLKAVNNLFCGCEPLREFGLIQHLIAYCKRRSALTGKMYLPLAHHCESVRITRRV